MKQKRRNGCWVACAGYVTCCALLDLLPRFGAPFFRYTGSEPTIHVWNLGWPLPLFIFDPKSGLHIGPFVAPVLGLQLVLLGLGVVCYLMKKRRGDRTKESTVPSEARGRASLVP